MDCTQIWNTCLSIVKDNVEPKVFRIFFAPMQIISYQNNKIILSVPSEYVAEQIENNYSHILSIAFKQVLGIVPEVYYDSNSENANLSGGKGMISLEPQDKAVKIETHKVIKNPFERTSTAITINSRLNPDYRLSNFVVGECNNLVYNAALAIIDNPGKIFNPLFVWGASGLGKTHLVNAIGSEVKKNHPDKAVLYLSANLFMRQFVDAKMNDEINDFIHFYQLIDVLILDDVQDLSGKTGTQNTFFHIFNHLHQSGKQIIMTCDKDPNDLVGIEERLVSRFKWSLVAEIKKPDLQTRKKIIKMKSCQYGMDLSEDIIDYIAAHVDNNVRELEGTLTKLMAHSIFLKNDLTLQLVQNLLGHTGHSASIQVRKALTVEDIRKKVCEFFNVSESELQEKRRDHSIVIARQMAMYLSRRYTTTSLARIGYLIGKKNHATVLYSCNTVENMISTNKEFKAKVDELVRLVNG